MTYALCPLIQLDIFTVFFSNNAPLNCLQLKKKKKTSFLLCSSKTEQVHTVKIHCLAGLLLSPHPCYTDLGANVMASS